MAYTVATGRYYTPRSTLGFYLGVSGSLIMVAMLTYPLRKRARFMQQWGPLRHWFRWHMIMGIVGPTLVLFHSTFHLRSLNATVALTSMLIVVTSGIIGRFIYTQIHYGLYGHRATLEKLRRSLADESGHIKSLYDHVPRIKEWVESFEQEADRFYQTPLRWWHLPRLAFKRRLCASRCARELRASTTLHHSHEFPGEPSEAIAMVDRYLRQAQRVADFTAYERLFALWHILHIPLIFLLATSAIFHVIAVYMY
ncbi:MAG: hypothetical protein NNA22_07720 [Nitrospira sp.]|nr:hypothetical protein [Nitrospira sp.]